MFLSAIFEYLNSDHAYEHVETWTSMDMLRHFWLISVITWNFLKPFILEIGLVNSYKMPPHLLFNLIRVLCILS